jgi:hypothetical protein
VNSEPRCVAAKHEAHRRRYVLILMTRGDVLRYALAFALRRARKIMRGLKDALTEDERYAVARMRAERRAGKLIEHGCTVDDLAALAKSGKRFGVILADPPLPFEWREPRRPPLLYRQLAQRDHGPAGRGARRRRLRAAAVDHIAAPRHRQPHQDHRGLGLPAEPRWLSFGSSKTRPTAGSALAARATGPSAPPNT